MNKTEFIYINVQTARHGLYIVVRKKLTSAINKIKKTLPLQSVPNVYYSLAL